MGSEVVSNLNYVAKDRNSTPSELDKHGSIFTCRFETFMIQAWLDPGAQMKSLDQVTLRFFCCPLY